MPDVRPEQLPTDLVHALCVSTGLNDFFETAFRPIAQAFGAQRVMLVDYHENTNVFDLLHFEGYSRQARFELQRSLRSMDLQTALVDREPYFAGGDLGRLYVPLYFMTTLEAVLVLDSDDPIDLTFQRRQAAKVVSRFVGLLMSSGRLAINQSAMMDVNDLHRAREIQLSYLPSCGFETDHCEVYGYNRSSSIVGGDYFDYFRLRDGSLQCIVADASGHGLSAALIMSTFRALLRSGIAECHDSAELFTRLNTTVHSASVIQYLTGVMLDFDESRKRLTYTNAGHFDPAIIRRHGAIERLSGGGPPLGMFKTSSYAVEGTEVASGDLLVLFTDGLTDLRDPEDDFFGEERILESVRKHRERPLHEIASGVLDEGMDFSSLTQPEDDLTLFMMRFR